MTEIIEIDRDKRYILFFDELTNEDLALVGGKNASLGEMIQKVNVPIPPGFAVTSYAYRTFIESVSGLKDFIVSEIKKVQVTIEDKDDVEEKIKKAEADEDFGEVKLLTTVFQEKQRMFVETLQEVGHNIRLRIIQSEIPDDIKLAIAEAYKKLNAQLGITDVDCAVRSSATAEDLPEASFAGQQETFLNVLKEDNILEKVKECFASLFTNRAISYREDQMHLQRLKALEAEKKGDLEKAAYHQHIINAVDHFSVALSVGVQQMARSDLASSGVIFTLDTDSGFRDVVYITGTWGLGEYVVQGTVNPDQFDVFKPTTKMDYNAGIDKKVGNKDVKLVYSKRGGTVEQQVLPEDQVKFIISDEEVVQLAKWSIQIEEHYGRAMDIEWAKDGVTGNLYIVQARPETVHEIKTANVLRTYKLAESVSEDDIILTGEPVGSMIGQGTANVIEDVSRLSEFKPGEVLITEQTNPDWEPAMRIAAALITERGGRTSHAAIVSRELGLPCIIGTLTATKLLKDDDEVTVDCSEGIGRILRGLKKFEIEEINLAELPETKTQVMMNLGVPDSAFVHGQLPHQGVGLARLEFIINDHIQFHPKALLDYPRFKQTVELIDDMYRGEGGREKLKDLRELVRRIEEKTANYDNKADYFIDKLAQGIARIGAAFYPYDVIVRLSDFKTNEYANLIGGEFYEPYESNPMIGWRGASRYYAPDFKDAFALECKALTKVRKVMGLKNVKVMVPFCRTPEEGRNVIKEMSKNGLVQGEDGLEVYVMAEIPSNVILAEEFAEVFDGFSIGSNDLTQLTLGLDRDSELVAHIFDERDEAVKFMLERVIKVAKKKGRKIGICGQAPSDFPSIAAFIVEAGINSMSLNPDTIIATRGLVYVTEWALNNGRKLQDLTDDEILNVPGLPRDLAEQVVKMINLERQLS